MKRHNSGVFHKRRTQQKTSNGVQVFSLQTKLRWIGQNYGSRSDQCSQWGTTCTFKCCIYTRDVGFAETYLQIFKFILSNILFCLIVLFYVYCYVSLSLAARKWGVTVGCIVSVYVWCQVIVTVWTQDEEKVEVREHGYLTLLQLRSPTHTFRQDLKTFKAQGIATSTFKVFLNSKHIKLFKII